MEKRNEEQPLHSKKMLRQRTFLLLIPVIVLPFVTILLWTFGLIGNAQAQPGGATAFRGLNVNLPAAVPVKDSNWNKLKYYEQADRDSAKLKSILKNDPFGHAETAPFASDQRLAFGDSGFRRSYDPYPSSAHYQQEQQEQKVYQKLARLQKELDKAPERDTPETVRRAASSSPDVDRLESMMHQMTRDKGPDTELVQLNDMLGKILDIQNPERVQEKLREQSEQHKRQAFALEAPPDDAISLLESQPDISSLLAQYKADSLPPAMQAFMESNRFYSLDDAVKETAAHRSIPAAIPEDQTLVSGATIKLKLMEDIYVAGVKVPKDYFVYGQAALNGERLQVSISSIEYQDHILPVALTVYDKKDGLPGIHIPGAITRDEAKKSAAQSTQGLSTLNTLDPSFGAQMATAGLQAAQNLIGKSAKLVRVTVEAGYPVLLKDDNQKDK